MFSDIAAALTETVDWQDLRAKNQRKNGDKAPDPEADTDASECWLLHLRGCNLQFRTIRRFGHRNEGSHGSTNDRFRPTLTFSGAALTGGIVPPADCSKCESAFALRRQPSAIGGFV